MAITGMTLRVSRKTVFLINLIVFVVLATWYAQRADESFFLSDKFLGRSPNATDGRNRNDSTAQRLSTTPSRNNISSLSAQVCLFKNVDAFDPKIIKKAKKFPPLNCAKGRPWLVYIDGLYLKVNISKVKENPRAENFSHCRYRTLTKGTKHDNTCIYGQWSKHFDKSISISDGAIFIETECYDKSKRDISNSYLFNVALNHSTNTNSHLSRYINHLKQFAPKESLNVLLVGIDGMSKQNFERSLPKTRNFLLHDLNAIELKKYNKVGLNTFPNVMPLLTGHHGGFYKSVNWTTKLPFDKIGHYFVWTEFSKAGYRTALDLEERSVTAFHYLKKGFYKSPVDYYTRPMVISMDKKKLNSNGKSCKGDNPSVSIHNDFLLELATRFNNPSSPYFAFSFLTQLSHNDQNRASSGDHLYLKFLQTLRDRNALNNTVLILFSDHGERFGSIRHTYNGIIESRSPGGFIVLPEWFKSKYPDEYKRLQVNAGRLTSVFDFHATLRDILYFKSTSPPPNLFPKPGISLFREVIPESRMCEEAGVPVAYCNCNSLKEVTLDNKTLQCVSSAVTDTMMKALGDFTKDKCQTIVPKSINSLLEQERPKDRIQNIISPDSALYQITIATTPGHGVFEAVVELNNKTNKAKVVGSISRLDMYKGEKDCITDPNIRPFCFCK